MSAGRIKWILFLLCVATLPLPFFALENGFAPALRLMFVGSLISGVLVQDLDPVAGILVALYLGQGLLWSALLYFLARFASRRVTTLAAPALALALVAVLLIGASFFPIYRTPLSSSHLHSNILEIFH